MKIAIFTSSPNKDGLTAACAKSASEGAFEGGVETFQVDLNTLKIGKCCACEDGWGTCFKEHACQIRDDFQDLYDKLGDFDAYIVITPVYWGEMSESAKAFFDRLRRCEASKMFTGQDDRRMMYGKPIAGVAAAGGSGNGTISCLESMERYFKHMGADIFDLITITRKSRPYKLEAIKACAREMVINKPNDLR